MKKLLIITAALLSTCLFSCSVQEDELQILDEQSTTKITLKYTQIDYEIVELINAYRISKGLQVLNILDEASIEATAHNIYMIEQGTPSHDNFQERSQNLRVKVGAASVSENVGFGYSTAESVVNAWLNSQGHKQNIENPGLTDFGISTKQDNNGKNYFTNIFVIR
jgi:uncharacterized protein YkwD